jgi:hypothetical protein
MIVARAEVDRAGAAGIVMVVVVSAMHGALP